MENTETYSIIRFYREENHPDHRKEIRSGLTLAEVKEHCSSPESCEKGVWFDGFEQE